MKTPEELAEEYADAGLYRLKRYVDGRIKPSQGAVGLQNRACKYGFLAGYQAAKDQFADTRKVMNSSEDPDSCEHIFDMEKMVDVNFSNNSNGWISVKDRLPELNEHNYSDDVLMLGKYGIEITHIEKRERKVKWKGLQEVVECVNGSSIDEYTHWMPLPKPPEE